MKLDLLESIMAATKAKMTVIFSDNNGNVTVSVRKTVGAGGTMASDSIVNKEEIDATGDYAISRVINSAVKYLTSLTKK